MKFSQCKEVHQLVKSLVKAGWEPIKKSRHWQVRSPKGDVLTIPNTPSDGRALMNFKSDLRRVS